MCGMYNFSISPKHGHQNTINNILQHSKNTLDEIIEKYNIDGKICVFGKLNGYHVDNVKCNDSTPTFNLLHILCNGYMNFDFVSESSKLFTSNLVSYYIYTKNEYEISDIYILRISDMINKMQIMIPNLLKLIFSDKNIYPKIYLVVGNEETNLEYTISMNGIINLEYNINMVSHSNYATIIRVITSDNYDNLQFKAQSYFFCADIRRKLAHINKKILTDDDFKTINFP
jgi:hypothetical protein